MVFNTARHGSSSRRRWITALGLLVCLALSNSASAGLITAQLTGDPRSENPGNLIVDVTITFSGNTSKWTIDLVDTVPATHPDMKLDAFFFNLNVDSADVAFSDFTPGDWSVSSPALNAQGSGSADFHFISEPNSTPFVNVTSQQDLTFTATLSTGNWTHSHFSDASKAISNDPLLDSFQLGAHLQGLGPKGKDSGFVAGDFPPPPPPPPNPVPEPGTFAIFAFMAFGPVAWMRRRRD